MKELVSHGVIESKIFIIRGKKVMLDRDLAVLYGVETRTLNQSVRRNIHRFPDDFMFLLTRTEIMRLSQFVITSEIKYAPNVSAFTQEGVAMLSSVLKSKRAIYVNIQIMRTFAQFRRFLLTNKDLRRKIEEMESKYDYQFKVVVDAINGLTKESQKPKRRIGFHQSKYGA